MAHDHEHDHDHDHEHDHDDEHAAMQGCIEDCLNCHAVCAMTVQYCLTEGGEKADPDLVGVLLDCAEICQTSANFMLRGSPYHALTCSACADICRACEEICRSVSDDEQLEHCAGVCAECAESCDRMAQMRVDEEEEGD
jgi:hypothetical protein